MLYEFKFIIKQVLQSVTAFFLNSAAVKKYSNTSINGNHGIELSLCNLRKNKKDGTIPKLLGLLIRVRYLIYCCYFLDIHYY